MKVLMISTDATLLGQKGIGDAQQRHKQYASYVERLDILVLTKKIDHSYQLAANCTAWPVYYWRMKGVARSIYKKFFYDLVVCQDPFITGWLGVYLKKKFNCKLIIHFHGDFLDNKYWLQESPRNYFYQNLAKKHIAFADSIRVVSDGIRQKLIKRGLAAQNIYKISTPVDLNKFDISQNASAKFSGKKVLTVGRIVKAKDFPTLFKVAEAVHKRIPELEWQIIGDGPLLKKFKQQTKEQAYLKWLGQVDHAELANYYLSAAFVVLTSNNESFGKVFLEAAMARKAAVATDTVGAREIVKDGQSGYIVPIADWQRLSERITYLLNNPEVAANMGQRAYELIKQNFGWQKNIDAIIAMWQQTTGSK